MDPDIRDAVAIEIRLFADIVQRGKMPIDTTCELAKIYAERIERIVNRRQPVHNDEGKHHWEARQAMIAMTDAGVEFTVARRLAGIRPPEQVTGWVEYSLTSKGVTDPAALIVKRLIENAPAPAKPKSKDRLLTSEERRARYLGGELASSLQH